MEKIDISVVIVNWNTKKLLEDCLASIKKEVGESEDFKYEVIVVDNNSEDGSQKMVETKFPQVKLLQNKENLGFAKANNQAFKIAKGKYVLLLNSDTYLLENSLKKLLEKVQQLDNRGSTPTNGRSLVIKGVEPRNTFGALSPMLLNEDRTIQQSVGFFPNLLQVFWWMTFIDDLPFGTFLKPYHVDHDSFYKGEHEVDWITGAAMLVPKAVIAEVGALDEKIFMYGEDVDWCFRIKKAGYKVFYSPTTKLVHIGRGSAKKVSKGAILGEYKGLEYFYKKHKSNFSLQVLKSLLKIGALGRILVFSLLGRKETARFYVEAFKMD